MNLMLKFTLVNFDYNILLYANYNLYWTLKCHLVYYATFVKK